MLEKSDPTFSESAILMRHILFLLSALLLLFLFTGHKESLANDELPPVTKWTEGRDHFPYVPGTDYYVRDPDLARPLGGLVASALAAIRTCDKEAFDVAMDALKTAGDNISMGLNAPTGVALGSVSRGDVFSDVYSIVYIMWELEAKWHDITECHAKLRTEEDDAPGIERSGDSIMDDLHRYPRKDAQGENAESAESEGENNQDGGTRETRKWYEIWKRPSAVKNVPQKDASKPFTGWWESGWGPVTITQDGSNLTGTFHRYRDISPPKPAERFTAQMKSGTEAEGTIFLNLDEIGNRAMPDPASGIHPTGEISLTLTADHNNIEGIVKTTQTKNDVSHTLENTLGFRRCGPGLPKCLDYDHKGLKEHGTKDDPKEEPDSKPPCPPVEVFRHVSLHTARAEALEQDAAGYREQAEEMRRAAASWRELAQSATIEENQDIRINYQEKARDRDLKAEEYDRLADEAEAAANEERQLNEEEAVRLEERNRPDCPQFQSTEIMINEPPEPVESASAPPAYMCGPDITDYVLNSLRRLYFTKWRTWDDTKRYGRCKLLLTLPMALSAWDIQALRPPGDIVEGQKYWFEDVSPNCAIPREPCGPSVTFLGQCIHAQVVNYIQWGFMNRLCEQEGEANALHFSRNEWNDAGDRTHDAQLVLTAVGAIYANDLDLLASPGSSSVPPAIEDLLKSTAESELRWQESQPEHPHYRNRPESVCTMACIDISEEGQEKLDRNGWTAQWGDGG